MLGPGLAVYALGPWVPSYCEKGVAVGPGSVPFSSLGQRWACDE